MRRFRFALLIAVAGTLLIVSPAQASFGIDEFQVGFENQDSSAIQQAGSHPFQMTTSLHFNAEETEEGGELLDEAPKDIVTTQPAGLIGSPSAVPVCPSAQFLTVFRNSEGNNVPDCPDSTALGVIAAKLANSKASGAFYGAVYNLETPPGVAAKIGFWIAGVPIPIELTLGESSPYPITGGPTNISQVVEVVGARLTLWGVPADPAHDALRGHCLNTVDGSSLGSCPSGIAPRPFLTLPRACSGPLTTFYRADPWTEPGSFVEGGAESPALSGCGRLGFGPEISARPTSKAATSPSGLDFSLDVSDEGLTNPSYEAVADSDIERAEVTLPEGMSANPALAEGLATCSEAELARETAFSAPGAGCPQASKIGTVEVETPVLEEKILRGSLYVATPYENPFGFLLALYVVVQSPELGIKVVQPLRVEPNPLTGRLTTVAEDMPELPFSHFRLHFKEGARSPLVTPSACGAHSVDATLYPYSGGAPVESTSVFEIISGPENGPCPSAGLPPFHPGLLAGTINNAAGRYSPFYTRIFRGDSEQEITHFSIKLPPGVVGKLAGIPFCPGSAIALAEAREGTAHGGSEELASPSCPTASEIGHTRVGSGVGPAPAYAPGKLYLAGPYHGSALSIVAISAAKVGPFDLGTVVVREALRVDPETAEVFVDSAGSDPIPHIIDGIPVHLRDIRVYVDRPNFVLNPTSCRPTSTAATVLGSGLDFVSDADDNPVTISTRFQAADCASLGFKPRLKITLSGKTHRGGLPKLKAVLTTRPGDANIGSAAVTLPASEILEQGHLEKVCPKSIWTQGSVPGEKCPASSIYGRARAITPLLDEPLEGPVYLRTGYGTLLPELVAALGSGKINIDAVGEIDAVQKKGTEISRLRTTFKAVPDAPVSRFVLEMEGGKKGLLINKTEICRGTHRAEAVFSGQNGRRRSIAPAVTTSGCRGKGKRHARAQQR